MTGATHISIGAALGAIIKNPALAFTAGVISHIITDALPHRDFSPEIEAILTTAAIGAIIGYYGFDSPQFWGALGAIVPDIDHALAETGLIHPSSEFFPTHIANGKYHGQDTNEKLSQLLLTIAAISVAELGD